MRETKEKCGIVAFGATVSNYIERLVIWTLAMVILQWVVRYDQRQRRLGNRPDKWHPVDSWLVSHGVLVGDEYFSLR